jgi:hypothetical protein
MRESRQSNCVIMLMFITIPSPKIGKERAVDYHAFFIRPKKKGAEGDNRSW